MNKQQKIKSVNLTEKELNVLISAIYDSQFTEEELEDTLVEDLCEPNNTSSHNEILKKQLKECKERLIVLQELKEKLNKLSWEL